MKRLYYLILAIFLTLPYGMEAQKRKAQDTKSYDEKLYDALEWRGIGPFRGGRSAAVTGVADQPNLFYMGATGGGVWRTKDGGSTWESISDGHFGGSIGAVAVAESDPNVIYVGGGEKTLRGNMSYGYGMYKSVDAGKNWEHIGLDNSRHISRIRIHPQNPDILYVAVMGDIFKDSEERGVYKSTDGGKTWQRKLFANKRAGAVDLILDPNNPRIMYASTWNVRRSPSNFSSGGPGSDIWKSTDSGENWVKLSVNKGLPKGVWGISGITVSPKNSNRLWAIIENENGGVFRSDDAGETWQKTNDDRSLRQRAWYYTRIYADSQDEDMVYVVNVSYHQSKDGGKTFTSHRAPHGDHHDLWIDPNDNQRMIMADDGGAQVSFDGGENWSTYMNQNTAQFYRVTTDNHFPFRIYGAQQDNSTVRIAHRTTGSVIGEQDWESTAGGESAHLAIDEKNNDIVYGGSYDGFLTRYNHNSEEIRAINVWPDNPMGHGAEEMKYRFQWNFPIFTSPHDPNKLYTASNHLHVTTNEGHQWETISPDLTRNDPSKLGPSGGPITKDNTSVEYYCTIFAAIESPYEEGLLWTGSDDGLVHVSKDGGENWENVTPKNMPEWIMINSIEADPFTNGGAYIAATSYKNGDYQPYLYKTKDYGKSWTKIVNGIQNDHFTRVVRADPEKKGLLYAGTETKMYISFDDGASWKDFQLNLPIVPITDLTIKDNHLIAATQGRGFWLIDDLTVMHQLSDEVKQNDFYLFQPKKTYRIGGRSYESKTAGKNMPSGVITYFHLNDTSAADTVKIHFKEKSGKVISTFSTHPDKKAKEEKLTVEPGSNQLIWNMRYPDAEDFDGMILWWSSTSGPTALPGKYDVELSLNGEIQTQEFEIVKDPRSSATLDDLKAQFDFQTEVITKLSETNLAIKDIRKARTQIEDVIKKAEADTIKNMGKSILDEMKEIEESLYQTKNRSGQDPLNYPIRLNNKLGHLNSLMGMGDNRPTESAIEFSKEVTARIDKHLEALKVILDKDVSAFNDLVQANQVKAVKLD
ncbi:WD40/YVTN/BNR-like repeat-containing protein [Marivirga harenae]|uniref:WD40/YVTN/BNR-like repeat-containing protein n=1 Tax=Marivirga harenae TaxID=2010992 RepID=UPI0026DFB696|nr:glycosyl hydrolase [Marivirga harenae]WKV12739.1 glycosyl hydrolase [Marivirga harenae]